MERVDLQYLCTAIGNLSGIPVRVYENGIQTFYTSMVDLPKDPLTLCRAEVFAITDHVGYYITPQFHYYGVLNAGTVKLVVGPTRQVMEREQDLRELAFRLDLSGDEAEAMLSGMRSIVRMPVESMLQMLCTINYVFNHERLELKDLRIYEQEQTALISRQVRQQAHSIRRSWNTTPMIWSSGCCAWYARATRQHSGSGWTGRQPSAAALWPVSRSGSVKICLSSLSRLSHARQSKAECRWKMRLHSATPISSSAN